MDIDHIGEKIICRHGPIPAVWDVNPPRIFQWKKSSAFVVNPRAILTHRVKSVKTHFHWNNTSHTSIALWCGNHFCCDGIVSIPPKDRLLCARCEALAVKAGEPSADSLAGFHAHIGEVRAKRLCCLNEDN